jgi:hypothetical protein
MRSPNLEKRQSDNDAWAKMAQTDFRLIYRAKIFETRGLRALTFRRWVTFCTTKGLILYEAHPTLFHLLGFHVKQFTLTNIHQKKQVRALHVLFIHYNNKDLKTTTTARKVIVFFFLLFQIFIFK